MSGILSEVITSFLTFLFTGGIGGIFYYRLNRRLKESEVKASELENKSKEINNSATINAEWERMCNKLSAEREEMVNGIHRQADVIKELSGKIETLNASKEKAWEMYSNCKIECAKKDRLISELNWYRCEINGCPYRKPPRKYGDFDFPENAVVKTENNEEKSEN